MSNGENSLDATPFTAWARVDTDDSVSQTNLTGAYISTETPVVTAQWDTSGGKCTVTIDPSPFSSELLPSVFVTGITSGAYLFEVQDSVTTTDDGALTFVVVCLDNDGAAGKEAFSFQALGLAPTALKIGIQLAVSTNQNGQPVDSTGNPSSDDIEATWAFSPDDQEVVSGTFEQVVWTLQSAEAEVVAADLATASGETVKPIEASLQGITIDPYVDTEGNETEWAGPGPIVISDTQAFVVDEGQLDADGNEAAFPYTVSVEFTAPDGNSYTVESDPQIRNIPDTN